MGYDDKYMGRNRGWRRDTQDAIVEKRLKLIIHLRNFGGWYGYEDDRGFEKPVDPQWFDLIGGENEYQSRTSWSEERGPWHKCGDYNNPDKEYYRPKTKEINRRDVKNELEIEIEIE